MVTSNKIIRILLDNRHIGTHGDVRHTIIAYTYVGKQLIYELNSYSHCCKSSRQAGHWFDHAETRLLQTVKPKVIYITGITQGRKIMSTTLPCAKCMKILKQEGVKKIVCNYINKLTIIKL